VELDAGDDVVGREVIDGAGVERHARLTFLAEDLASLLGIDRIAVGETVTTLLRLRQRRRRDPTLGVLHD
jgi:hypothetical protein